MSICSSFVTAVLLAAATLTPVGVAHAQTEAAPSPEQKLSSGPGAPTPDLVRSPGSARVTQVISGWGGWGGTAGLYGCSNAPNSIICYFVFTRTDPGPHDYNIGGYMDDARLIDNWHVQHRLTGKHFYNGLGEVQDTVDLDKGESMWTTLEFEAGRYPIKSARLLVWGQQIRTAIK
jgi:hypothetical protein